MRTLLSRAISATDEATIAPFSCSRRRASSRLENTSTSLNGGDPEGIQFIVDGARKTFDARGPLRANNGEVIRDAAVAGLGIALQPEFIVHDALQRGALVSILEPYVPPPLTLYAVYPHHRQSSVTIRAFVTFLSERFATIFDPADLR